MMELYNKTIQANIHIFYQPLEGCERGEVKRKGEKRGGRITLKIRTYPRQLEQIKR